MVSGYLVPWAISQSIGYRLSVVPMRIGGALQAITRHLQTICNVRAWWWKWGAQLSKGKYSKWNLGPWGLWYQDSKDQTDESGWSGKFSHEEFIPFSLHLPVSSMRFEEACKECRLRASQGRTFLSSHSHVAWGASSFPQSSPWTPLTSTDSEKSTASHHGRKGSVWLSAEILFPWLGDYPESMSYFLSPPLFVLKLQSSL